MPSIQLVKTNQYPSITLSKDQWLFVSSNERIAKALKDENCTGYNIETENETIGFILIRKFHSERIFLWNILIDIRFQQQGIGKLSLQNLIDQLRQEGITVMTTTCLINNPLAIGFFERLGFSQCETVILKDTQEVNLILNLNTIPSTDKT